MDLESCWEKPPSPVVSGPGVPAEGYWFDSVACSSYRLLLLAFSAWLSGAPSPPSPSAISLPCPLLHSSQCSPCTHPNQKQFLQGKSTQNPEFTYGEGDVEKQSKDCWLSASSPTLLRRKWHFSASQYSMTTFECPNGTVCIYDRGFSFVTGTISVGAESC